MEHNKNDHRKFSEAWDSPYSLVPDREIEESWEKFSTAIKGKTKKSKKKHIAKLSGIAALLIVLLSTYFFAEMYNPVKRVQNNSQVVRKVKLPDGSLVFLEKGASIHYRESFENARGVRLKGDAFFKVTEDSLKSFCVTTGPMVIKVFGTSFYVKGKGKSENVAVSLFTGSVSVAVKNKTEPQKIVPGERFVYQEGNVLIENFDVNLSFKSGNEYVDVDSVKLTKLYNFLGDRFDYKFEIDSKIKNTKVTLRIEKSDSLEQLLKILSIISNTAYEVNQATRNIQILSK